MLKIMQKGINKVEIIDITPKHENHESHKIRLGAYVRVSSASDAQEHSYTAQILYFTGYVKEHPEYELVDIYADEGISGTDMEKRSELMRLLRDCSLGKIDRVICKSLSRFARNTEELLYMIRMLKGFGVSIYFEDKDIDSEKLNMEMIMTFPGMAAQQESEAISGNLRWSYQKRMERGEFICVTAPYGYNMEDGELVINEAEAEHIRRIYKMYLDGIGIQSIVNSLNAEGIKRRKDGARWQEKTIKYILTNEKYIGDSLTKKTYMTAFPYRRKINNGEYAKYYVRNNHPPIIKREDFEIVQELLKKKRIEGRTRTVYPLSGKLRCPECGGTFRRQQLGDKVYWFCMKSASSVTKCKSRRVREDAVLEIFIKMVYTLKMHTHEILASTILRLDELTVKYTDLHGKLKIIDGKIADYQAKKFVLSKLQTSGVFNSADYIIQNSEIDSILSELRKRRRDVLNDYNDPDILYLKHLETIIKNYEPTSNFDGDLFRKIVEKIVVHDNSTLTFHLIGGLKLTENITERKRCC